MDPFKTFTIADPRDFDGNAYEVAERAVGQLQGLIMLAQQLSAVSELMARNSEMSRRMDLGGEPEGDRWTEEPQGRQWAALNSELATLNRRLRAMKIAAGFDPKHPSK